jgi:hypothetical protein
LYSFTTSGGAGFIILGFVLGSLVAGGVVYLIVRLFFPPSESPRG